jgi:hypothetical protein
VQAVIQRPLEVFQSRTPTTPSCGEKKRRVKAACQHEGALTHIARRSINHHRVPLLFHVEHLNDG